MAVRLLTAVAGLVLVLGVCVASCATVSPPRHTGMPGEALWLSRCDNCHEHPSPERFDRVGWTATLERHHERTSLTAAQWAQLLDFLSYRPSSSGGELASRGLAPPTP